MLARHGPATDTERPEEPTDPRTRHRRRLAESDEKPPRPHREGTARGITQRVRAATV